MDYWKSTQNQQFLHNLVDGLLKIHTKLAISLQVKCWIIENPGKIINFFTT